MDVRWCGPDRILSPRAPYVQVGQCRAWWSVVGGVGSQAWARPSGNVCVWEQA